MIFNLPPGLSLRPFQKQAVKKMVRFLESPVRGCYNACEMGLGKSIQTIACINHFTKFHILPDFRVLVVCPAIARLMWRDELKKWLWLNDWGEPQIEVIETGAEIETAKFKPGFTIIGYDLLKKAVDNKRFMHLYWRFLVLDEAHYVKNPDAKRTKAVLNYVWKRGYFRILLSGTPMTNSVTDLFSACNALCPNIFDNFYHFVGRYTHVKETPWGNRYTGIRNSKELRTIIRDKFFLRYRKEDVLKELPPKQFTEIRLGKEFLLKTSPEERKAMEAYHEKLRRAVAEKWAVIPRPPISVMTKRREQGLLKVKAITELSKKYLTAGIPICIFAYHTEVIKKVSDELKQWKPAIIQGSTSPAARHAAIESFQHGRTSVIIGQIQTCGIAVTLTAASTCILAEFTYNPSELAQSIDRLHRIGQKKTVDILYLLVENSVEERVIEILMEKVRNFEKTIN